MCGLSFPVLPPCSPTSVSRAYPPINYILASDSASGTWAQTYLTLRSIDLTLSHAVDMAHEGFHWDKIKVGQCNPPDKKWVLFQVSGMVEPLGNSLEDEFGSIAKPIGLHMWECGGVCVGEWGKRTEHVTFAPWPLLLCVFIEGCFCVQAGRKKNKAMHKHVATLWALWENSLKGENIELDFNSETLSTNVDEK